MAFQTALVGRNSALSGRGSSTTLSVAFFMPVRTALSLLPRFGPVGLFRVGMGIGPVPAPAVPVAAADGLLLIECLLRFGRQALELCLQGKGLLALAIAMVAGPVAGFFLLPLHLRLQGPLRPFGVPAPVTPAAAVGGVVGLGLGRRPVFGQKLIQGRGQGGLLPAGTGPPGTR